MPAIPKRCYDCGGLLKLTRDVEQSVCICKDRRRRPDPAPPGPAKHIERVPSVEVRANGKYGYGPVSEYLRQVANKA